MKIKNPFQSATEKLFNQEVEKEFYLKAAEDIENNIIDKGLWTKAFAMSQGDEAKQKAIYIELIVEYYKDQVRAGEEVADILAKEEEKVRKQKAREEKARQDNDPEFQAQKAKQAYEEKYLRRQREKEKQKEEMLRRAAEKHNADLARQNSQEYESSGPNAPIVVMVALLAAVFLLVLTLS